MFFAGFFLACITGTRISLFPIPLMKIGTNHKILYFQVEVTIYNVFLQHWKGGFTTSNTGKNLCRDTGLYRKSWYLGHMEKSGRPFTYLSKSQCCTTGMNLSLFHCSSRQWRHNCLCHLPAHLCLWHSISFPSSTGAAQLRNRHTKLRDEQ